MSRSRGAGRRTPHKKYAAIGALVGVLAGLATWLVMAIVFSAGDPEPPGIGDRVHHAAEAFESGDHIYVGPDGRDLLSADAEERLEKLARESSTPTYITVWDRSSQAGYYLPHDAAAQIATVLDEQAVYVVYTGPELSAMAELPEYYDGDIADDFHGDAERRLAEVITSADGLEVDDSDDGAPPTWLVSLLVGGMAGGVAFAGIAVLIGIVFFFVALGAGGGLGAARLGRGKDRR